MKLEDFKTALIHYVKEMDEYYGMTEKETAMKKFVLLKIKGGIIDDIHLPYFIVYLFLTDGKTAHVQFCLN